ncbi:hypothetical protein [Marinobacterium sp. BA1]|uniref:hypothetical protein n=1 Tax=Marinobacterium sp. BA1 TaxID=3138931 RepID=UPI0032E7E584
MNEKELRIARAETILEQLGGRGFRAMCGVKHPVAIDDGIQFQIGRGAKNNITHVVVRLDPSDTYNIEFGKMGRQKNEYGGFTPVWRVVETRQGVYGDQLPEVFSDVTGYETRMPRVHVGPQSDSAEAGGGHDPLSPAPSTAKTTLFPE